MASSGSGSGFGSSWAGAAPPVDPLSFYYEQDCADLLETEALSGIVRRQSKYGSTSSHGSRLLAGQRLLTHVVQPHDTLPGESPPRVSSPTPTLTVSCRQAWRSGTPSV